MEGAGCVLEEGQRLNFGYGDSEMFKSVCVCVCVCVCVSVCVCVCDIGSWTSTSAVLEGV